MTIRNLKSVFRPSSVALIGASRRAGSVGDVIARNLLGAGFAGPVMLVNPKAKSIASTLAYPDIRSLPHTPELAVICTPPETIPDLIAELGEKGTRAALVITAGFSELGEKGTALQNRFLKAARPHLLRVVGPNCLGLLVPGHGLNASFAPGTPRTGDIAFVSQSGAVVTAVLDWADARQIGFSHVVSLGGMADVDFGDMLDYLAQDSETKAILLYVEAITHARKFMSAARAAARLKPVVVIKAGRHAEGAKAASSHTGALAGADEVYDSAFRRAGLLRVIGMDELFAAVETLAKGKRLRGDRLGILTNGGGIGVLATDRLIDLNGRLADLQPETITKLNDVLPPTWSKGNPVDIIGDAPGERYAAAFDAILDDGDVDAVLVLNCPTAVADSADAARAIVERADKAKDKGKAVFTAWLGESQADGARDLFEQAGLPTYETPGLAVQGFMHRVTYERNQKLLRQVPPVGTEAPDTARAQAQTYVDRALDENRVWLTEVEAKAVLKAYGIPIVETVVAATSKAAVQEADRLGFPVAVKILSPDITHKSDMGGVALNLRSVDDVRRAVDDMFARISQAAPDAHIDGVTVQPMIQRPRAHELIVGLAEDPTFGPVVLFGQGGTAVEVLKDKALALPPLDGVLADALIRRTRVFQLLKGYRDRAPADLEAIKTVLQRIAQMAAELPDVVELDINPLWADEQGVLALDARIRVVRAEKRNTDRFAIAPYPAQLEGEIEDRDGNSSAIRPVRPQDRPLLEAMLDRCATEDIYTRFFSAFRELPDKLAARLTQIDYDREMGFVVLSSLDGEGIEMLGMGRLMADPDRDRAEYSVMVRSDRKGTGLGYGIMRHLLEFAEQTNIGEVFGHVLRTNRPMLHMCDELGFERRSLEGEAELVEVVRTVSADRAS